MMADGKNNHKRKELDTKLDANTMDNVEYQKEKLKIVHQRSWIHIRDPKWVQKIIQQKPLNEIVEETKISKEAADNLSAPSGGNS